MEKYKVIAICGKAGSGKDAILHQLDNYDVKEIVSCTTRPMRQGEQEGIDYYYLSNEDFAQKVISGEMLEATVFNDWCYGTMKSALDIDRWNIGVFNPDGIEILTDCPFVELYVFYIYAPDKLRLMRQLTREDDPNVDEIVRRYEADKKDFQFLKSRFDFIQLDNIAIGEQAFCARRIAQTCGLGKRV